jgi:hypothetical protein
MQVAPPGSTAATTPRRRTSPVRCSGSEVVAMARPWRGFAQLTRGCIGLAGWPSAGSRIRDDWDADDPERRVRKIAVIQVARGYQASARPKSRRLRTLTGPSKPVRGLSRKTSVHYVGKARYEFGFVHFAAFISAQTRIARHQTSN